MPTQSSACTVASLVSSRFSSLLQALETQWDLTLRNIKTAKEQALGQALNEIQRLTGHLEALSQYGHSVQDLLGQADDCVFFQVPNLGTGARALLPHLAPHWLTLSLGFRSCSSSLSLESPLGH